MVSPLSLILVRLLSSKTVKYWTCFQDVNITQVVLTLNKLFKIVTCHAMTQLGGTERCLLNNNTNP